MSTALYRRYRPDSFADVIGQEHVTEPLTAALRGGRVTHAYLFSGPRGCGKTTSARIFARCLNCAQGPTDTPCGECDSCVELARGGPGSLDVVELDAASHGGVDDARELRERAAFAPVRDRYKVFIIDEAHMVTTQGFNALLKLVEEPPEHVKFVFATTEPEKVIGTIRSRTHHYPFRLVPPEQLLQYLGRLADAEQVAVADGVLPLVVRAGGGSVRDSLSVLDQLIAGADGEVSYERSVALLGFTHATLLDDAVEALAARDGASLFRVVDRVISTGHAPRRFVEDLLERLRDLIVVLAAGDQAGTVLRTVPDDQLQRMRSQAENLRLANASRAADLTNEALTEMVGATSPRLQLELLCARLLLPAADDADQGYFARLERLEHTVSSGGPVRTVTSAPPSAPPATPVPAAEVAPATATDRSRPAEPSSPDPTAPPPEPAVPEPAVPKPAAPKPAAPEPAAPGPAAAETESSDPAPAASAAPAAQGMTTEGVRHRWAEVLGTLAQMKRITWALVQNAQVQALADGVLTISFPTEGLVSTFRTGPHTEPLRRAVAQTLGLQVRIETAVAGASVAGQPTPPPDRAAAAAADWARPASERGGAPNPVTPPQSPGASRSARDVELPTAGEPPRGSSAASFEPSPPVEPVQPTEAAAVPPSEVPAEPGAAPVPIPGSESAQTDPSRPRSESELARTPPWESEVGEQSAARHLSLVQPGAQPDEPDASDPDLEGSDLVGAPLVERMLGGTVIDEITDEGQN
ncbi:MAG: DNA polymerase III subunit gamma and tau [Beutenbergiaceae bacterium]